MKITINKPWLKYEGTVGITVLIILILLDVFIAVARLTFFLLEKKL